ncbi:methyltransferase domain-containing protein [Roseiconus lacunae]|uniref:methyltransferase domain-containing protein n=1 Tax=Roseiconus lacunae TaxID=2605694 RepID=UPI0011F0C984|nr:methyltransferase domain-containing protein [Roseiconus lacunae]
MTSLNTEAAVRDRYSGAAAEREPELCCPIDYDRRYLEIIPQEVIDRDYGCGDPSKYVREGETVLDLGSGGGKICFIAAQKVGPTGSIIGVDMNDDMLDLARRSQPLVAEKMGYDNLSFRKGKIQDMTIDRDAVDRYLRQTPINNESDLQRFEAFLQDMRLNAPLIPADSIDVIVSNCVLNLVDGSEKQSLFRELFRVLKPGGRAVISDIVSDEPVPKSMQQDATLWSGCISGALQEKAFIDAFTEAGFQGPQLAAFQPEPWQTVEGIEFRSATVIAYKFPQTECFEHHEAVVYQGPYASVHDDDGHRFTRGVRTAVCRKTFLKMRSEPYGNDFIAIEPAIPIDPENAAPFDCTNGQEVRSPKITKAGRVTNETNASASGDNCCGEGGCC